MSTVLMLAGLPGTGKTALAYELARILNWTVLDKDVFNTDLLNAGLPQSKAGPLAYELLFTLARDFVVRQGHSVILDTAGRQPRVLEQATLIANLGGSRLRIVRCVAPHGVRIERMTARVSQPSQWTADETTEEEESAWYVHLPDDTLTVRTDQPFDHVVNAVVGFIQNGKTVL